jgi:hypothetical protein
VTSPVSRTRGRDNGVIAWGKAAPWPAERTEERGAEHGPCFEGQAGTAGWGRSGGGAPAEEKGRPAGGGGWLTGDEQGGSPMGIGSTGGGGKSLRR